ncbi:LuxR C-terminal-related transcriptional regulator [bacterium]|nr:LuxR C-terminal-related transcriptional regulator [bacterium]
MNRRSSDGGGHLLKLRGIKGSELDKLADQCEGRLVHDGESVQDINRRGAQMLGYEPEDLRGRLLRELGSFPLDVGYSSEVCSSTTVTAVHKDGSHVNLEVMPVRGSGNSGEYAELVFHFTDCCKGWWDRLQRLSERLEELNSEVHRKEESIREVLLQVEKIKRSASEEFSQSVDRILMPMIDLLKQGASAHQIRLVNLMESYLESFGDRRSPDPLARQSSLTPREMQICQMIREGLSTGEIASILRTSTHTVATQRKVIRKKLGLIGGEINLGAYLQHIGSEE